MNALAPPLENGKKRLDFTSFADTNFPKLLKLLNFQGASPPSPLPGAAPNPLGS